MEIDDLKSDWKNAGKNVIEEDGLKRMTSINHHPTLKKIRRELLINTLILVGFLAVYYDAFDGQNKPIWLNMLLVTSACLYTINNFIGYLMIKNPVKAGNILVSIRKQVLLLRRLSITTLLSSVLYSITFIAFFSITIEFSPAKYIILAVMVIIFVVTRYFSYKRWIDQINHFGQVLTDFKEST